MAKASGSSSQRGCLSQGGAPFPRSHRQGLQRCTKLPEREGPRKETATGDVRGHVLQEPRLSAQEPLLVSQDAAAWPLDGAAVSAARELAGLAQEAVPSLKAGLSLS